LDVEYKQKFQALELLTKVR